MRALQLSTSYSVGFSTSSIISATKPYTHCRIYLAPNGQKRRKSVKEWGRASLVEVRPRAVPTTTDGSAVVVPVVVQEVTSSSSIVSILSVSRDRVEDMQAEVKAMARVVDAKIYSPHLLSSK